MYARGFVAATDGNVSMRLPNGNILSSRSSVNKGAVTDRDFVEVDLSGNPLVTPSGRTTPGHKPSSELGMHLYIYSSRPDIHAVVHAHPVYATGFAVAHYPLTACVLPEVIVGLGAIPLAEYATPSTREVAESLAPFVMTSEAILLANHGVVTYGKDPWDAFYKMEKVEHAASVIFVARMLGGEKTLTESQLQKLGQISGQAYGKEMKGDCSIGETGESTAAANENISEIVRYMLKTPRNES